MTNLLGSRVAFTIFGVDIYWYGIFITLGILVAFLLAFPLCKRKGLSSNVPYEILIAILPLGIICARLFSVLFDSGLSIADYFKFREGGMSIIGAVIGAATNGILADIFGRKKIIMATAIIFIVGSILCGLAPNILYGQEITNPSFQFFPFAVNINGVYYEALFFYESVLNLLGFVLLISLYWKLDIKGIATGSYLVYYGTVRFFLEPRRQAEYILKLGNIQISRLLSLVMILAGIAILIYVIVTFVKSKKLKKEKGENGKEVLHAE